LKPAVVGRPDELKGQALVAFVTVKTGVPPTPALREGYGQHVAKEIGRSPSRMIFVSLRLAQNTSGKNYGGGVLKQIGAGLRLMEIRQL